MSLSSKLVLFLLFATFLLTGCRPKPPIARYKAPKPAKTEASDRMLGAIVLRSDKAWFFKLTGSIAQVAPVIDSFQSLVKSVTFDDQQQPSWKLPEGWSKSARESTMRFATLNAPAGDDGNLEVSVSSLPVRSDAGDDYVLVNINRWREQMQLRPLLPIEMKEATEKLTLADGEAFFVSVLGKQKADSRMGPFAGGPPRGAAPGPSPPPGPGPAPAEDAGDLTYTAPSDWRQGKANSFRKASFEVGDRKARAEITIIELGGGAGGTLLNVNRWRGQVGLPEDLTEEQLAEQAKQLPIDDLKGQYVELRGESETILAVIAPASDRTWFIKLKGDNSIAEQEKERFEAFVKSIRFK